MTDHIFLDVLMVPFALHIIQTYLTSFRRETIHSKVYRYAAWSAYILFLYMVIFSNSKYPLLTILGNTILMALPLHASGYGDIKTALFRSCIYHASRMVLEVITQNILLATLAEDPFVAGNLISTIAMYIVIQIYKRWKRPDLAIPLSFRHWIRLFLVPFSSILIIHYAHMTALHSGETPYFYFLSIFIILNNYLIFDIYDKMSTQALIERQNQVHEQEIRLCIKQAAEREESYRQTRILRHDLTGRLIALNTLLESGQITEAESQIKKMLAENSMNNPGAAETGNLALDSLINYKYAVASAEGSRLTCRLDVPAELFVEDTDLCVILENLLNNALEAVQKLPQEDRKVTLTVQLTKNVLVITVENPFKGDIAVDCHGRIQSHKSGDHGIGLLSIERTAKKYDGDITIRHENGRFLVSVMLLQQDFLHKES